MASSFGPHSSIEDIEDEILLLDSLIDSLEPGSLADGRRRAEYENQLQELQNLLASKEKASSHEHALSITSSRHTRALQTRKRSREEVDDTFEGAPLVSKSRRTSSSSSRCRTPSVDSLESISGVVKPGTPATHRALQRQRQLLESAEKDRLQRRLDEEFARRLQSGDMDIADADNIYSTPATSVSRSSLANPGTSFGAGVGGSHQVQDTSLPSSAELGEELAGPLTRDRMPRRADEELAGRLQPEDIDIGNADNTHLSPATGSSRSFHVGPSLAVGADRARPAHDVLAAVPDPFEDLMEPSLRNAITSSRRYIAPQTGRFQGAPQNQTHAHGWRDGLAALNDLMRLLPFFNRDNTLAGVSAQNLNAALTPRRVLPFANPSLAVPAASHNQDGAWEREAHDEIYGPARINPEVERRHLQSLMGNIESADDTTLQDRDDTPPQMSCTLYEHQKIGLTWLKKMETGSNKGGILADDMGLGKTVQIIALMVSRPSDDPSRKTNLIVAPVALLQQWKDEIERLVKPRDRLSVLIHHGPSRAKSYEVLRSYDVVLTTYGQLTSDRKRKLLRAKTLKKNPHAHLTAQATPVLTGRHHHWYRVILDEAQNIKNKDTKTAIAASEISSRYRFCVTGTPMMNSVTEAYSLIRFLRIPPFDEWNNFRSSFHSKLQLGGWDKQVMERFQAVLGAMMLRRTKKTLIDGKPIDETLPDMVVHTDHFVFSEEEKKFYKTVETLNKDMFRGFQERGEVETNYMAILVLLLRLRQACCHPLLIRDLSFEPATDLSEDDLMKFTKMLAPDAVERIKNCGGNFICPICLDATRNPALLVPCGHEICADCLTQYTTDPNRAECGGDSTCPQCRVRVDMKRVADYTAFMKVFMPDEATYDSTSGLEEVGDSDDSGGESETESLSGFIVDDDEVDDDNDDDDDDDDDDTGQRNKTKSKGKKKSGRPKDGPKKKIKDMTLGELAKESRRNSRAKQKYLRRLRKMWKTSSKIEKTLEILTQTYERDSTEKTIIFSQWTSLLDLLEVPLMDHGYRYLRYDGSMNAIERAATVSRFVRGEDCNIILVSLKAGNAGLNLTRASQVIILDPFWNPYIESQAIDRAHRIGQRRVVHVHRLLVKDSVEDRIMEVQEQKRDQIDAALDERAAGNIQRLGRRQLAYLFGLRDQL